MTLNAQVDRAEDVYLEWRINTPEQKYVSAKKKQKIHTYY